MNIAILGGRGIGRIHAGVFHRLGHTVSHVLGTSLGSAAEACRAIGLVTGHLPTPYADLETLLDAGPDAVVIATPPTLHRRQVIAVAERGVPILCEKPLFWEPDLTYAAVLAALAHVRRIAADRLFVASPNASLVRAVSARLPPPTEVRHVRFTFHTQGPYQGRDIGVDLLTHALTVIDAVIGLRPLSMIETRISPHDFFCRLRCERVSVEFDLHAHPATAKRFEFQVNDHVFRRLQHGAEATYRVCMLDVTRNEELPVEDPFVTSARAFAALAAGDPAGFVRHFEGSARIFQALAEILCDPA